MQIQKLIASISIVLLTFQSFAQDFYIDEPDRDYLRSGTFMFGMHWNKFDPLFDVMNYDIFVQSGAYDLTGSIYADSTDFVSRSNYFGLGFNINGVQCLMSGSFRRTSASNFYQLGFGMGFNQILHFSYKTGQPTVWFEGLVNYNFLHHNTNLKNYEINQFPIIIEETPFPDLGLVPEGNYRLNVEFNRHIIEPVMALNFALTRSLGLRFAAAYSFFLNQQNADLFLRFKPAPDDNSGAKAEKIAFNRNIEHINVDGAPLTGNHFDLGRWNFNISLVFRMVGGETTKRTNPNYY